MPLKVFIVGAGIGGLCAGIALRQAGHTVEIFEKSKFASEVGAALMVTSNGARVLSQLGFSFSAAQAVQMDRWTVVRGDDLELMASVDFTSAEERFGAPIYSIHRVDLHSELLRLATDERRSGHPIRIHLASEVVNATVDGSITLSDGSLHTADLIVAADGLHSILKRVVLEHEAAQPVPTGMSAFRFLIDTDILEKSDTLSQTLQKKGSGATLLADTAETVKERHIMWYPCRNGHVQNFVGIHPTREPTNCSAQVKDSMLEEFGHFSPEVLEIIKESSHVKCWPLFIYDPLPSWFNGRVVLVGDAAHPMLPFGGQGSNSAIEDGGTLGYLFRGLDKAADIPERLRLFQRARQARASRIQILSSVRAGREKEVQQELRRYADPPGSKVPSNMMERTVHDYSFDIFKKCEEIMTAR